VSIAGRDLDENDVRELFSSFSLDQGETAYINKHAKRIAYLRNLVQKYCAEIGRVAEILDVGPHFLSRCLVETISPKPNISTLGYPHPKLLPAELVTNHMDIDLNDCGNVLSFATPETFDIIIVCEVIEHLFVSPDLVFTFLRGMLKKPTGLVIVGTPNAVSFWKRLKMVMGQNPFEELSHNYKLGKGHIREYTMQELNKYAGLSGFSTIFEEYCSYWDQHLFPGLIPTFRKGVTLVLRQKADLQ
jgi:hypothetical protein